MRQKPPRSTAATSWLRERRSALPRVSAASCVMHAHYPLYDYPFAVKVSAGRGTKSPEFESMLITSAQHAIHGYVRFRLFGRNGRMPSVSTHLAERR